jgi:hypothetical protein
MRYAASPAKLFARTGTPKAVFALLALLARLPGRALTLALVESPRPAAAAAAAAAVRPQSSAEPAEVKLDAAVEGLDATLP